MEDNFVLVEIINTYGKSSGDELSNSFVVEDTPDNRVDILEEFDNYETYDNVDDFILGKINTISFDRSGGDWDEPTGVYVVIKTIKEARKDIENVYKNSLKELDTLIEEALR